MPVLEGYLRKLKYFGDLLKRLRVLQFLEIPNSDITLQLKTLIFHTEGKNTSKHCCSLSYNPSDRSLIRNLHGTLFTKVTGYHSTFAVCVCFCVGITPHADGKRALVM